MINLSWAEESKEIRNSLQKWINWYIGELDANFSEQDRSLDDITFDEIEEDLEDAKSVEPLQSNISNYALAQTILNQIHSQSRFGKHSNQLWPSVDTQTTEPEDRNYANPIDDIEMGRENNPGYNKRRDWYNYVNENGDDSEISLRGDQTSLNSGASWRKILSDYDPEPGFIPTNDGMRTPEDIIEDSSYTSYAVNRDYDKQDPDYSPEKSRLKWRNFWMNRAGWSEEKLNKFEKRYKLEGE